jgi:hypothetical protein
MTIEWEKKWEAKKKKKAKEERSYIVRLYNSSKLANVFLFLNILDLNLRISTPANLFIIIF